MSPPFNVKSFSAAYTLDNPERLEEDIRRQILILDAVSVEKTNFSELFEIRGSLAGPNTRILKVKTVWMQEFRTGITKFITLYPNASLDIFRLRDESLEEFDNLLIEQWNRVPGLVVDL